jgi:hypothetical protein
MIHEFDPVIYPRKLWVTYDATSDELNEYFPTGDINDNKFKDETGYYGITYRTQNKDKKGGVLIRFADNKESMQSWNMIHEAMHAAGHICDYVGIQADWDNDEAFVYLTTWIVKCCEKVKIHNEVNK